MKSRPWMWLALLPAIVVEPGAAAPVALSETGEGSALIAPFWSVRGGHDALITLRNNGDTATAARLRVIEADGIEVLSLNVYLDEHDTWVAALTNAGTDEMPDDRLITGDRTCVLPVPERDDAGVARIALPPLAHGNGYLEIVEMGQTTYSGVAGSGLSVWPGCDSLAEDFDDGPWASDLSAFMTPPGERLSASVQLINVGVGGMVSPTVTALTGFSDIVQHTAPESDVPNLSTAHTPETDAGRTESRVCDAEGCSVHAWNLPVEAVASVLAVERVEGSYSTNPAIRAVTAFAYTRPLARFEDASPESFGIDGRALLAERSREAVERIFSGPCLSAPPPPGPGSRICGTPYIKGKWALPVELVQFGESPGADAGRTILGTFDALVFQKPPVVQKLPDPFVSGELQLHISQDPGAGDRMLTSIDDRSVPGDAVIGFAVQQISNGTLEMPGGNPVLANYRVVEDLVRVHRYAETAGSEEE